jgi:acyl dehydratase
MAAKSPASSIVSFPPMGISRTSWIKDDLEDLPALIGFAERGQALNLGAIDCCEAGMQKRPFALGMRFRSRENRIMREDIKRFASEFDPQPIHLGETAAALTPLKGLAASGWHTAAMIAMRLLVEVRAGGRHPLWGLGVDELRWLAPVRPDDVQGEVTELIRPMGSLV